MTKADETFIQRSIQLQLCDENTRLFRNNVGFAWQGSNFTIREGQLFSGKARGVHYGLANGSSDLVGPHSVIIEPWMIGTRVAVLCTIETKSERQRLDPQQRIFLDVMKKLGGLSGVARSVDEARAIITSLDHPK